MSVYVDKFPWYLLTYDTTTLYYGLDYLSKLEFHPTQRYRYSDTFVPMMFIEGTKPVPILFYLLSICEFGEVATTLLTGCSTDRLTKWEVPGCWMHTDRDNNSPETDMFFQTMRYSLKIYEKFLLGKRYPNNRLLFKDIIFHCYRTRHGKNVYALDEVSAECYTRIWEILGEIFWYHKHETELPENSPLLREVVVTGLCDLYKQVSCVTCSIKSFNCGAE